MSKKGAKMTTKEQSYEFRDVVLAKVRGYPPWPGMVVDPESAPKQVQKERPNAKTKKGNWYCVRFFPAGDYAWIVPKDISKLQPHEIEAYINEPYKRSGDLLKGYRIAADPSKWEDELEAARVEAAEEEANAEIDQLQSDEEEEGDDSEKSTKSKKRKRESDAGNAKAKTKPKAKKGSVEPASKKRAGSATKSKKNGVKSKATVESEDEGGMDAEDEDAGPSKQASPPPTKKAKRDKDEDEGDAALVSDPEAVKVRDWRHKLQKAFLNPKVIPKSEDMPALDQLFSTVENYESMNIQYLTFSKIGKVMRHIHALAPERVPRDEEYKFRERAKALVDRWQGILNTSKATGAADAAKASPATNGSATKAADAEDAVASANGKEGVEESAKTNGDHSMEVEANAKPEETSTDAPAVDAATNEDAPGDAAEADTSVLADVTMSEAAA